MATSFVKVATLAAGISGLGFGGYGIYHLTSHKETIRDRIISSLEDKKKRFLGIGDSAWSDLSSKYASFQNKPKKNNGTEDLLFSEIPEWCEKHASEKYSDIKKDLYSKVLTFCFFNTNTLLSNIDSGELKSSEGENHVDWQNAWDLYNKDSTKTANKRNITDGSVNTDINGNDKAKGGKAMHKWCNETSSKKMYEAEELFPIFKHWCVK
ncbi:hypothetical protein MHC_02160 [Mycoplasma haemocanis str. Illinois]|uniref:Uncharacterized protein n=1 Tax=Mycoplasma haemocanis (strain Illinois) TaxID=1111676 RepID=H6N6M6_MYCHN|nr:hypothetical protein [Mycoplasma haemocanis]AEW45298.1 hypothetical protein MHC_02160 [Mycoplasma haemocanis str. Illinois]